MNNDLQQLLEVRRQKENNQRQTCKEYEANIEQKKMMLGLVEQSLQLYKSQKSTLESALFNEIEGKNLKSFEIEDYQKKVKEMKVFEKDLESQLERLTEDVQTTEAEWKKACDDLVNLEQEAEKINLMIDQQTSSQSIEQRKEMDTKSDEKIDESWNSSSHLRGE